jgi:DNA-binding response OmpR family regulator
MEHVTVLLLVDDSHADATLVREALKASALQVTLHVVPDGEKALAFLRREGLYTKAPRPDLVLLDLNLPQRDGHSILAEIRRDPALLHLPVVIFSSSTKQDDVDKSYELGANLYVRKPLGLEEFFQAVRMVMERWASFRAAPHDSPAIRADLTLDQRELAAKEYEQKVSRKGESAKAGRH